MKKLFYVTILCSLVLPYIAHAEETDTIAKTDSAFFHAIYQKDISYAADSDSIISEKRQLILIADTILNSKDSIGIILEDTSLFQLGLKRDTFVFCLRNTNVAYWDTVDSPMLAIQYIQQESSDTLLYSLPLSIIENKSYAPQPTPIQTLFSPQLMGWTIGGIVLVFILFAGCVVLTLCMLRQKEKKPEPKPIDTPAVDPITIDFPHESKEAKEIERLNAIIQKFESERSTLKSKIEAEAKEMLDKAQKAWDNEKERILKAEQEKLAKKDREIDNIKEESQKKLEKKDKEINSVKEELKTEKDKVKTIRDEVTAEKKKEIDGLNEKLNTANEDLRTTKKELTSTKNTLEDTQKDLSNANSQIEYLQESQRQYAEKITFVPYAEAYSNQIKKLFDIEHSISEGVIKLSKKGLEDPYHLFKATHRFKTGLAEIDMEKFQVEVEMAAKKQMTFTGNGIAHLATLKGDELAKQVRLYFVLNYLSKYIGALQIYNESLIGLEKLMNDVNASDVSQFVQARQQLESLYAEMQIKVICPHLFDSIGNNMDLRVEQIDAGYDSGDILEIMNCLVYAVDGQKPTDKIFVKAQQ